MYQTNRFSLQSKTATTQATARSRKNVTPAGTLFAKHAAPVPSVHPKIPDNTIPTPKIPQSLPPLLLPTMKSVSLTLKLKVGLGSFTRNPTQLNPYTTVPSSSGFVGAMHDRATDSNNRSISGAHRVNARSQNAYRGFPLLYIHIQLISTQTFDP